MKSITKKVAKLYGGWSLLWLSCTGYGLLLTNHGEFGVIAHLWLIISGLPLSLLSLQVMPNGSFLAVLAAGVIGMLQWSIVAEVISGKGHKESDEQL